MKLGAHVSAAGGLHLAPVRASESGLECFQFFSRAPQGGPARPLNQAQILLFIEACDRCGLPSRYIHAPYVINLASPQERVRENSIAILKEELSRGSSLGVTAMMTHLGSASALTATAMNVSEARREGVELAASGLRRILAGHDGATRFLVEIAAGAGQVLGDSFEEIGTILDLVGDERLGVCLDTAHAFAAGYDLRTSAAVAATLKRFDETIGLERLVVVHVNDSKTGLGTRRDRHEHIGRGEIGADGFKSLLASPALKHVDLILETPDDENGRKADTDFLRQWRRF